ncbi:Transient receptor putative cation channel subfamily M member 2 [Goodea atripinnis]|uniref:Transient receptor putative cation channel subfamily M member 2 n=1 Tax=Goodea atripinnis TaxID=208336 RepID=A0ABV0NJ20_9TELE
MSAALAASKILKKMAEEGSDADEAQDMLKLASHYENHAIGVFSKCHNSDEERAQKLLVRMSPLWGKTTCLRLALEADDKNFVAQSGVQALLTQIWCGEISVVNPVWKVLVCMVFFPLIYTKFLVFRSVELIQRDNERNKELKNVEKVTGSTWRTKDRCPEQTRKPLGCWSRLEELYCSPQVKFYGNIVSYFAFLLLFAVVLMIDFQSTPSTGEQLLYIWLLSLVCEEIRQLFHDPDGFGFCKKAKMYIHELWNILDILSILLFCVGLGFSIWVVAYGVAKQGILIHNDSRLDWIIRGAVYEPYLIIFGNFPENIDNAHFNIESCSMNGTDPLKPKCPVLNENQMPAFPEWLTIIMLCVYLLFANILLLNLLIAIFNFTFQEIQDNTDKIWKFQRYELIKEYHSRPAAPPPFIILSHLCLFIRKMLPCCPRITHNEFSPTVPDESSNYLRNAAEKEGRFHVKSRELYYPKTKIERFPVPEEYVTWQVSGFSAPQVLQLSFGAASAASDWLRGRWPDTCCSIGFTPSSLSVPLF